MLVLTATAGKYESVQLYLCQACPDINLEQVQIKHTIHILDYKPKARTEKPYAQLLTYALALSRSTGLKLMDFKCAWFDEHDYFEFFPLHLIHKPGPKK